MRGKVRHLPWILAAALFWVLMGQALKAQPKPPRPCQSSTDVNCTVVLDSSGNAVPSSVVKADSNGNVTVGSTVLGPNSTKTVLADIVCHGAGGGAVLFADSPYTIPVACSYLDCDASAGAVVLTLPVTTGSGREITLKKIDSSANSCTPTVTGSDVVDGASSYGLTSQWASSKVVDRATGLWDRSDVNQLMGDVTGISVSNTVGGLNGTALSGLATGLLKNTTITGVPTIASANTDYLPVASPSITGTLTSTGTAATDSASLGAELTTSGTCSGTGWTGTYPNYIAPATTAPLTCTGFANNSYYQLVTGITNNAGVTAATYTSGVSATGSGTCALAFNASLKTVGYTSGLTVSGTTGQHIILTFSDGSVWWLALTGSTTLAATATFQSGGTGYASGPTTATATQGTASSVSGTAVLATTLNSGATGTIAVTSNTPGAITITAPGTAYTNAPTGAAVSNGTLTCTGPAVLTSTIGGGTITVSIGGTQTAVTSNAASSTLTAGLKSNGTSLTYTPTAAFVGTMSVSAKLITPVSGFAVKLTDSTSAVSYSVLQPLASLRNVFVGGGGTYNTTGNSNTANGYVALYANTTGSNNTANGMYALNANTTGNSNTANGYAAGRYITGGSTGALTVANSVFDGYQTMAKADGDTNEIIVGYTATGQGSNTATIGNASVTDTYSGQGSGRFDGTGFVSTGSTSVSGCSLTASSGGATAGKFSSGTSGSCVVTVTPGFTAPNGFSCFANDITTPADKLQQLSVSQTTPTIGGTTLSGDVITWGCIAY